MDLRKVLQVDAWGSAASVVFTIAGAGLLGGWLGVSPRLPIGVGLALVPWAALLIHTTRQRPLPRRWVGFIAGGNLAWAVAAGVIIFGYPEALTVAGRWIVGVFSLLVAALGLAQARGLTQLSEEPV